MNDWKEILDTASSSVWKEEPVDFVTFVTSPEFLYRDPELFPIQLEEALNVVGTDPKKMFSKTRKNHLYVWLWGKGCFSGNTKITDICTGETHPIRDWSENNRCFTVWAWDEEKNKFVPVRTKIPYSKGYASVFRVKTKGRFVEVSEEHKFYTKDGWKQLKELKVGDEILLNSRLPEGDVEYNSSYVDKTYWGTIEEIESLGRMEIFDFEVPIYHAYSLYGIVHHNSGKGTVASILYLYALYVLSCMRSPQKYFGTAPSDEISLVNVATTYSQAKDIVFARLEKRFQKVKWFRDRFKIIQSGKVVGGNPDATSIIELKPGSGEIRFVDTNIAAKCLHAQSESWEGKNLIFWIMDEACLSADTPILDKETGDVRTVKEWSLLKKGFTVDAFNISQKKVVTARARPPFCKGIARVYEVKVGTSISFKISKEHKLFTKRGWEKLADLHVDDEILVYASFCLNEVAYESYCDSCYWMPITSIQYVGEDEIYDFEVPYYHNYFLNGVLHHNSGFRSEKKLANAAEIYATLQTSTRELPWIGIITSFPRLPKDFDFTYNIYRDIVEGRMPGYGSLRRPWETRPGSFGGQFFDFVVDSQGTTVKVPEEYREYFTKNPEDAKKKYLCMPPSVVEDSFFEYLEDVSQYIRDQGSIVELKDRIVEYQGKQYLEKIIVNAARISDTLFLSVDAGEKHCDSSLTLGHVSGEKFVVDAILVWRPQEKIAVNINNLVEVVGQLARMYKIAKVRIDHWNAASLEQQFRRLGTSIVVKNVGLEDYNMLKNLIYTGVISFPNQREVTELFYQLKGLKQTGSKPRVVMGKQDIADSVAGVVGLVAQTFVKGTLPRPVVVSRPSNTVKGGVSLGESIPSLVEFLGLERGKSSGSGKKLPSPRRVR